MITHLSNSLKYAALLLLFVSGQSLYATIILSDDFDIAANSLNGSTPDVTTGGATWTSGLRFDSSGSGGVGWTGAGSANQGATVSLTSAGITDTDTLSVTVDLLPVGDSGPTSFYVGFGTTATDGFSFRFTSADSSSQARLLQFWSGGSSTQSTGIPNGDWDGTSVATVIMTLDLNADTYEVSLGSQSINGNIGSDITQADVATFKMFSSAASEDYDFSYIDSIEVNVTPIPEPNTATLGFSALIASLLFVSRKRRVTFRG